MDERCEPCKEAGYPNILAHYKAIPAGRTHTGKAQPAMCWDHKNGKLPKHFPQPVAVAPVAPVAKPALEVFDRTKARPEIDKPRALALRKEGKTWRQVADAMGVKMDHVYQACRALDTQPKPKGKWEECLTLIASIAIGESKTVAYPVGGNRGQMGSIIGINHITWEWRYSLRDNRDGTVTATKIGLWSEVDGKVVQKPEEEDVAEPVRDVPKEKPEEDWAKKSSAPTGPVIPYNKPKNVSLQKMLEQKKSELAKIQGEIGAIEKVIQLFEKE